MDNEKRKKEMVKRLGRMEALMSAGERKRIRDLQKEKDAEKEAELAKRKPGYDVGSTSYEMVKRLGRMEEIAVEGKHSMSKKAKKDLWARLAEQATKKKN